MDDPYAQYAQKEEDPYAKYAQPKQEQVATQTIPQRILSGMEGFNDAMKASVIPAFAGGILQGAGDIGASVGNVGAAGINALFGTKYHIPHPDLGKYLPKTLAKKAAFGLGQISSQIPLYASGAGLLGRVTGLGERAALGGKVAQGALSGALMGENKEGEGRLTGALVGGAIPVAQSAYAGLKGLKSKNIAKEVLTGKARAKEKYSQLFNDVFKKVEERGLDKGLSAQSADTKIMQKAGHGNYIESLKMYNKNPTLKGAHDAQSDLAKYINKIGKPNNALDRKAIAEAIKSQSALKNKISTQFEKTGNQALGKSYSLAREGYRKEFIPYTSSKSIKDLESGKLRPKKFASRIAQEEDFLSALSKKHPKIERRELLKKVAKNPITKGVGIGVGASVLPYSAMKYLK